MESLPTFHFHKNGIQGGNVGIFDIQKSHGASIYVHFGPHIWLLQTHGREKKRLSGPWKNHPVGPRLFSEKKNRQVKTYPNITYAWLLKSTWSCLRCLEKVRNNLPYGGVMVIYHGERKKSPQTNPRHGFLLQVRYLVFPLNLWRLTHCFSFITLTLFQHTFGTHPGKTFTNRL